MHFKMSGKWRPSCPGWVNTHTSLPQALTELKEYMDAAVELRALINDPEQMASQTFEVTCKAVGGLLSKIHVKLNKFRIS